MNNMPKTQKTLFDVEKIEKTNEKKLMKKTTKTNKIVKVTSKKKGNNGKNGKNGAIGFEDKLWKACDKMRNNMDSSEYKHVVLGLIFLKYISDAFEEKYKELVEDELADPEDPDYYMAENIFWVPKDARWSMIKQKSKTPEIGVIVDDAMDAIEKNNSALKGVLPKIYAPM